MVSKFLSLLFCSINATKGKTSWNFLQDQFRGRLAFWQSKLVFPNSQAKTFSSTVSAEEHEENSEIFGAKVP